MGAVREGAGDAGLPAVVAVSETQLSPWVQLVARRVVRGIGQESGTFHSFRQADYVCVVPRLTDGRLVFVRQFRAALERVTLELPAGLREGDEDAAATATRELHEEVGLDVTGRALRQLAVLDPDSLRLENRLWCFFAEVEDDRLPSPIETGIEPVLLEPEEMWAAVSSGEFTHALHLCAILLATKHGLVPSPTSGDVIHAPASEAIG